MKFSDIVGQAVQLLQTRGRVTYRAGVSIETLRGVGYKLNQNEATK